MKTKCKHVDCLLHTCTCVCVFISISVCVNVCILVKSVLTLLLELGGYTRSPFFRTSLATPNLCVYVFLPCIPILYFFAVL